MKEVIEKFGMDTQGNGSGGGGSNALNSFMSLMSGEKGEFFAKHPLVTEAWKNVPRVVISQDLII